MNRQVMNTLEGHVQYPARKNGLLHGWTVGVIGILCLSIVACQPLSAPMGDDASGSETTVSAPAEAPAPDAESNSDEGEAEAQADAEAPEESGPEETEMIQLSEPQQQLVDMAKTELSAEMGYAPEQITVTSIQGVDFSDASLGCPEEGMMYAQVITSGYQFMLEVDGTEYEYHGAGQGNGRVVRC